MLSIDNLDNARIEEVGNSFILKIFAVFLVLALASLGLSYAGKQFGKSIALAGHTDSTDVLRIDIDGERLAVPANMIRFASQRRSGEAAKIDLYLSWPLLQGYTETEKSLFNHSNGEDSVLFLSIEPREMSFDMSARFEPIYKLLIEPEGRPLSEGLVEYEFLPDAGYNEEVLIVEAASVDPFVARCLTGPAAATALAACERDLNIGQGLSLRYRFPSRLLPHWQAMEHKIKDFAATRLAATKS